MRRKKQLRKNDVVKDQDEIAVRLGLSIFLGENSLSRGGLEHYNASVMQSLKGFHPRTGKDMR